MKSKFIAFCLIPIFILNIKTVIAETRINSNTINLFSSNNSDNPSIKSCDYCGKKFKKTIGFIYAAEVGCANSYSHYTYLQKVGQDMVANGKMSKSDYLKWLNGYNYSKFYCSKKCVVESGSKICIGN